MVNSHSHRGMRDIDKHLSLTHSRAIHNFLDLMCDVHKLNLRLALKIDTLPMNFHIDFMMAFLRPFFLDQTL